MSFIGRAASAALAINLMFPAWGAAQMQASAPVRPFAAAAGGPASAEDPGTLTWAPPTCGDATHDCVDLYLPNTGSNQTPSLSDSSDYRIHLPSVPLEGGLQIRGGHNVIINGGQINLSVPCSDDSSPCHGINIVKPTSGEVFVEGVWILNPESPITQSTGDGIDIDDPASAPSDIVLQNVRIDGISGCSGGPDHADVLQPYSVPGASVHIDHLTGTTNCQGAVLDPDLAWSDFGEFATEYAISDANINVLENPYEGLGNRYAWWLTGGSGSAGGCASGPVLLRNVYAQEPDGQLAMNSVWPDTDQPAACRSVWAPPTLSFPNSPQISGVVTAGTPPGGDYVPKGAAGIGYVSPGYAGTPAPPAASPPAGAPPAVGPTAPPAPAGPAADTTPPRVMPSLARGQRLTRVLARGLVLRVACSEACRLDAQLRVEARAAKALGFAKRRRSVLVGTGHAAGAGRLVVRFAAHARHRLRAARRLTLSLAIHGRDPAGNRSTVRRSVRLTRKRVVFATGGDSPRSKALSEAAARR